ncbi:A-agglutinin anchorage subunit-like [Salvia hispanica]|uniref:A-agglutinin anchorage subunit-like n=1 Tax=Salvia hispanica TaxID=49212 RepID=UPI0020099AC0|nr:A-agglutinin anchorage subunit-like [Salvia hispanica]
MKTVSADPAVEEMRGIAKSYYDSATPQVKEQAERFFNSMDLDGDGEINLVEFLAFMRQQGYYKQMQNNSFFKMLDTSGRGTLAFMDVITLYYIIKSGRPFCDSCHRFIHGTFFSCLECFNQLGDSFSVCPPCHKSKSYDHNHHALFLDNFTLLQATKPHLPNTTSSTTINQEAAHTKPTQLLSSTAETQQPLLLGKDDSVSTSTSEKKHVNSEAANTEPTGISATAKTQQPLLLGKGDSASTSTSKNGDTKSEKSLSVTPVKSVAKTSTPSAPIKSSLDQNAIVPATKTVASTSTSKNDAITMYMTSEIYRVAREQTRSPPPSRSLSPSRPLNQSASVNVARSESMTSTPNTIRESRPNQLAIVPATQQVPWMKVASAAFKVLDAMVVVSNVIGVVSACTIM